MVNVYGSTAVVTGGQRGLGKALVAELIKRGAFQVYATARQPEASTDPRVGQCGARRNEYEIDCSSGRNRRRCHPCL